MKRLELFLLLYSSLVCISTSYLSILGEKRVDAYIALTILIHFIITTVVAPEGIRERFVFKLLNTVLMLIFIAIVAYRIWEVLKS